MTDPTPRPQPRDGERRGTTGPDEADFEPRERALLEEAVRPVAQRGRGATITIALVIAAFAIGLVRPWDWLGGGPSATRPPAGDLAAATASGAALTGGSPAGTLLPTPTPAPGSEAAAAETCAYPQGWRSATLQNYAGRRALVWTAIDAVEATGPLDPAITFEGIAGDRFTAVGWCAPVYGPESPPRGTSGTLYRIDGDRAIPEPFVRLHPADPNPFGELWGPVPSASDGSPSPAASTAASIPGASPPDGAGLSPVDVLESGATGPTWAPGRYVIELGDPSVGWVRWLGLDLRLSPQVLDTAPGASNGAEASGAPGASGSSAPAGSPAASPAP